MIHFYKYIYIYIYFYTHAHITQIYCCSDFYPIPWNISLDENTLKAKTSLESEALMLPDILGEGYSACSKQKLKDYQASYQVYNGNQTRNDQPYSSNNAGSEKPWWQEMSQHPLWLGVVYTIGVKIGVLCPHPTRGRIMSKVPGYNRSTWSHKSPCGRELSPSKGAYLGLLRE